MLGRREWRWSEGQAWCTARQLSGAQSQGRLGGLGPSQGAAGEERPVLHGQWGEGEGLVSASMGGEGEERAV